MNRIFLFLITIISLSSCSNQKSQSKSENGSDSGNSSATIARETKNILFFGNSLTAGYGLDDPATESFPAIIQQKIDSLGLPYKAINAGSSGETTAGGKERIGWLLKTPVDVFVLELGANDGLRGIPVEETTRNLQAIVDSVKSKYPEARMLLLGMEVPPNMGDQYTASFRRIFRQIAEKNDMAFVPFLLDKVAGIPSLNLKDGIHPTAEGQKILAENVWPELERLLTDKPAT